ncbi:dihydroxyacetone kinase subunit DhaL [Alkalicoccus saliphilus]|uniref:phosphoenolpyruvate--glycerone phosphotransferase n=1 Tax=Alkalicoccus saliphilus TaxID=200989 RepID=A0A2T4U301_9BACI|nr:dihydroxyacetone kinase subunit DhaL [Alkalicoccus saliphilus]PTL37781.1 dihydroxyacetone kinase subunit L [Alkalicoccus saliphilus]
MITTGTAKSWMENFKELILENKDELTTLDQAIGDGDHGINMARGVQEMDKMLQEKTFETPGALLKAAAMVFISKIGGASGPLYGSALMKIAAEAGDKAELTDQDLLACLDAGKKAVQQRGRAETGEKTMYDVWDPVVSTFRGEETIDWEALKTTAQQAVKSTVDMHAKKGRAAYLGARSVGHTDPGAFSSRLFFEALADAAQKEN